MEGRQLESLQQETDITQAKVHEMRTAAAAGGLEGQKQMAKHMLVGPCQVVISYLALQSWSDLDLSPCIRSRSIPL